jgi:DNA adenine methylase
MNLTILSKVALLDKCNELGITKYKSKNKSVLIELINSHLNNSNKITKVIIKSKSPKTNNSSETLLSDIHENNTSQLDTLKLDTAPLDKIPIDASHPIPNSSPVIHLKPLIKWSGGKGDEIKIFEKYFPNSYDTYIEPFVGGGAVYFYLNPEKAVISDVHTELVDLYRCIANGKMRDIYDYMKNTPNTEEMYYKVRDDMKINEPLDNAKRFYYQRKTCFRGMLRYNKNGKFNIPFGKYKTINYNDLTNINYELLLSRTEILNSSFEYIFNTYNDPNNFMFLDPPYDSEFTDYGYCQFGREEHTRLATLFKSTKIKCLIIIGKTDFILDLYKDYIVAEYDKKYKFKLYGKRIGDEINTKHLVIKNF